MTTHLKFLLGTILTFSLLPIQAQAHWCNDLWGSAYNIVVRPASDTVTVPASGSANLDIFVQNNMGYPLSNFVLSAKGTATIPVTRQTQKVANTLLPGEKAKYTLAISKSGGGDVGVGDITFSVSFGSSGQSGLYPVSPGKAVMIRKTDGSLVPAAPPAGIGTGNDQARQLQAAAVADFSNVDTGLDKLMSLYCAGRKSWGANDASVVTPACSGAATDCTKATRSLSSGLGTKFDYTKLWAAGELAARKSALGSARLATLRTRLQCGASDPNLTFTGFSLMVLGYLGDDTGARTFLEGKVGTTDIGTIAKAALYLFGTSNDKTKYSADVKAGLTSKTKQVAGACAAALGIVDLDDANVSSVLIPMAKWIEPDTDDDTPFYASHLLELVAWDRRGWAAQAADKGPVTFYEGGTPVRTGGTTGSTGSTGAAGSTGTAGGGTTGSSSSSSAGSGAAGRTGTAASSGTPTGGSTVIRTGGSTTGPSGGIASSSGGGTTSNPVGGNNGSTGTPSGGSKSSGAAGSSGTSPVAAGGSSTPRSSQPGGGSADPGSSGEAGNTGNQGNTVTNKGSAGGCGYVLSGQAPFGFLMAAAGLALVLRRRRK